MMMRKGGSPLRKLSAWAVALAMGTVALGQQVAGLSTAGAAAWDRAREGEIAAITAALRAPGVEGVGVADLRAVADRIEGHIAQREATRAEQTQKLTAQIDAALAGTPGPVELSKALRDAVELHIISVDKGAMLLSDRVVRAVGLADSAARSAEARGDWLIAGELFGRLNLLYETEATFKADAQRLAERLGMVRLYAPERLWTLRSERRKMDKLSPLPAYNGLGENYRQKLNGVSASLVRAALSRARLHVERVAMRQVVAGGLGSVRTLITTPDVYPVLGELSKGEARQELLAWIDLRLSELGAPGNDISDLGANDLIDGLLRINGRTARMPESALMHEFGNGCFGALDEFSAMIWPDELARFKRLTDSSFVGVGIQIQLDEEQALIKVIRPIEGMPAQRAGIRAGDFIRRVNEQDAMGLSTDQAIELITGPENTAVELTVLRDGQELAPIRVTRARIPIESARGWRKTGPKDSDWDWFIDRSAGIGYVRLLQFSDRTTAELHAAIDRLKQEGLNGVILDLRFNPGGLLNEAVSVANSFIERGTVVYTRGAGGQRTNTENAEPGGLRVVGVPVVVLINEGSASASEIVSGALRHYADQGRIDAVLIGERSFGKGSVQNVIPLSTAAQMKLTTQYYYLPNDQLIHRRPGASAWGVEPHLRVEMLPKQITDSVILRADADLPPDAKPVVRRPGQDENGDLIPAGPADAGAGFVPPDPQRLLDEGTDLQLEVAVAVLRAKVLGTLALNGKLPAEISKPAAAAPGRRDDAPNAVPEHANQPG